MPLSDFVIVRVMSGSDLHRSRSEFHIDDDRVSDDREMAVRDERMFEKLSMKVL